MKKMPEFLSHTVYDEADAFIFHSVGQRLVDDPEPMLRIPTPVVKEVHSDAAVMYYSMGAAEQWAQVIDTTNKSAITEDLRDSLSEYAIDPKSLVADMAHLLLLPWEQPPPAPMKEFPTRLRRASEDPEAVLIWRKFK
jgi:hypothetical protein